MAILNLYLDLDQEYINLTKDLYKILTILIVFQIMVSLSSQKNIINSALTGSLLNDDFMTLLLYVLIGILAYYLVFDKVLNIN
jgi:hypothetical protein